MANAIDGKTKLTSSKVVALCKVVDLRHQKAGLGSIAPLPIVASENIVRRIIRNRGQRRKFFPKSLFADPAWDILLELYAAELGQTRITFSGLSIASNVPSTTVLRWINTLEDEGLVERANDPLDARRYFVSLTETGALAIAGYFASLSESSPAVAETL